MDSLDVCLQDIFAFNKDFKIFKRVDGRLKKQNMHKEFQWVLRTQCNGNYIPSDWIPDYTEGDYGNGNDLCICGHPITQLYTITHRLTGIQFQVGSNCVYKIGDKTITKKMNRVKRVKKAIDNGDLCVYCSDPLLDKRKKFNREGFCDKSCSSKMKYVIPFGQSKGELLVEVMCKKNNTLLKYVKNERKKDPTAFSKYVLFLEIIDETVVETVIE